MCKAYTCGYASLTRAGGGGGLTTRMVHVHHTCCSMLQGELYHLYSIPVYMVYFCQEYRFIDLHVDDTGLLFSMDTTRQNIVFTLLSFIHRPTHDKTLKAGSVLVVPVRNFPASNYTTRVQVYATCYH